MKNRHLVIPCYRVAKVCHDDLGRVTWEKRWYFHEWELMQAFDEFMRAAEYWLPDSENGTVILYHNNEVLSAVGYGIEVGRCGIAPCGADCSICLIGGGI